MVKASSSATDDRGEKLLDKPAPDDSSAPPSSSVLEAHLRDGRWDDARKLLRTPSGRGEVEDGLVSYQQTTGGGHRQRQQRRVETPALWTAVFHRAPVDVIRSIYDIKPDALSDTDLHCAVETRSSSSSSDATTGRDWDTEEERLSVVEFLAERSPKTAFIKTAPPSVEGKGRATKEYTPLGHAVDDVRVSTLVVTCLCFRGPEAIDVPCLLDDPNRNGGWKKERLLPIDLSVGQPTKRDALLLGSFFYSSKREDLDSWDTVKLPRPDAAMYESALLAAEERGNYRLVGDLLPDARRAAGVNEETLRDVEGRLEARDAAKDAARRREAWTRKNLGPVMYFVDVVRDLFSRPV